MKMARALCLVLVAAAAVAGCGDDDGGKLPTLDCTKVQPQKYSELTLWPTCTNCHDSKKTGAARQSAPSNVNFDSYDAAKSHASEAAAQVNGGLMPPPGSPQPTDEQKQALYAWALCGTPN